MNFELTPIIDQMLSLYEMPRSRERFERYLFMLQGTQKGDMVMPIQGYNPMAKEAAISTLNSLKKLNAEELISKELEKINRTITSKKSEKFQVVINVADDLQGAWSDFYATGYSSRFDIGAIAKRNFCTPFFWTSETISEELILKRAKEAVFRTIFYLKNQPKTLGEFFEQEVFVQSRLETKEINGDFSKIEKFLSDNSTSDDYNLIFNFFFGDDASDSLGYARYGMKKDEGFAFAKFIARRNKLVEKNNL